MTARLLDTALGVGAAAIEDAEGDGLGVGDEEHLEAADTKLVSCADVELVAVADGVALGLGDGELVNLNRTVRGAGWA